MPVRKRSTQAIHPPLTSAEVCRFARCPEALHIARIATVSMYDFLARYREASAGESFRANGATLHAMA